MEQKKRAFTILLLFSSIVIVGILSILFNESPTVADSGFYPTGLPHPGRVEFDTVSRKIFVLHGGDPNPVNAAITKLSADSFQMEATYNVGNMAACFSYYQPSDYIYYVGQQDHTLYEFDCASSQVLRSLPLGAFPRSMKISHSGSDIYIICGTFPKYYNQTPPLPDDLFDANAGQVIKVDRSTFQTTGNGDCHSGPLFMAISDDDSRLYLTNSVPFSDVEEDQWGMLIPEHLIDEWFLVEEIETANLTQVRQFKAATPFLGRADQNLCVIGGGNPEFPRPTQLLNLSTGVTQDIDTSAYQFIDMTQSVVSSSLNKAFVLMQTTEFEPPDTPPLKGDILVVDTNTLQTSVYNVGNYFFDDIFVDLGATPPQLILFSVPSGGLYSVSPIP